jgi:predicted RNA-binding protein
MAYWLYITNSDNWEITKERNLLGAAETKKNALARVNKGDRCLVYVKSETINRDIIGPKIVGEYEVVSEVFEDGTKVFVAPPNMQNESYRLRIMLEPVKVFASPIEFKPLIPKLFFLPNKKHWTGPIRGKAIVKIPKSDYDLIVASANK